MNYKVKTIPFFDKQAKRLSRKYASFKEDVYLLSVFDKSEKEDISDDEIKKLLQDIDT
jgi:hypothetical protein